MRALVFRIDDFQATGAGKLSAEDTTLPTSDKGGSGTIFVPAGTLVAISFTGVHKNRTASLPRIRMS